MPRFPIFADNHLRQQLVDGLLLRGWDVQRAIDVFPEKTPDSVLFRYAAEQGRVFATNDEPLRVIADEWLTDGKPFTGLVIWRLRLHDCLREGWFIEKFERLAEEDDPFPFFYPIRYLTEV